MLDVVIVFLKLAIAHKVQITIEQFFNFALKQLYIVAAIFEIFIYELNEATIDFVTGAGSRQQDKLF